jgi:hypothetical protein
MIDREKVSKVMDAMDAISEITRPNFTVNSDGTISMGVWPATWGDNLSDENRHKILGVLTPLVGRLDKKVDGTTIDYKGWGNGISISVYRIDSCKIVGYKKTVERVAKKETRVVKKEEEVETGEFEEEEKLVPITDCQIREGKASESDIEVPA